MACSLAAKKYFSSIYQIWYINKFASDLIIWRPL